ncbi:MAG TPA: hypothetical protein VHH32_13230 [Gemmatimonadales bacterium]|nr:hypothetical protein [Gemmatimonadales bacterium]
MQRDVVTLLHELRPEEGLGEGIDQLAALVHHAYLFWNAGSIVIELNPEQLLELLTMESPPDEQAEKTSTYIQFPERLIWAQVIPGESHEPLDGIFQHAALEAGVLRVLGVFGMHPDRPGFSVVEVTGPKPTGLSRKDGTPLFSSILPGGGKAGLYSIAGAEELLELGWRCELGARSLAQGAAHSALQAPGS